MALLTDEEGCLIPSFKQLCNAGHYRECTGKCLTTDSVKEKKKSPTLGCLLTEHDTEGRGPSFPHHWRLLDPVQLGH